MWHDVDGMGWWMAATSVWVLFLAIVLVWAVSRVATRQESSPPRAIDVAKERYARGEISSEELAEMRRHLGE
jgi:uncharacterized membrane protein